MTKKIILFSIAFLLFQTIHAQPPKVVAFYTGKNDLAHISFAKEANDWLEQLSRKQNFSYYATTDWKNMNDSFLASCQLVIFLDTRPDVPEQRTAFETYMKNGGAWMGFHFSAFALTPSAYSQNWSWYHEEFLGSGEYGSNTWRPTSAILKIETGNHPATKALGEKITASPNEWYRWNNDLRKNRDIEILLSIDSTSFPVGTGPKQHEIWHSGYYPVVWTNKKYKMIYFNMGHNDMDYEGGTNKTLSHTFGNPQQDQLITNAIVWLLKTKH